MDVIFLLFSQLLSYLLGLKALQCSNNLFLAINMHILGTWCVETLQKCCAICLMQ